VLGDPPFTRPERPDTLNPLFKGLVVGPVYRWSDGPEYTPVDHLHERPTALWGQLFERVFRHVQFQHEFSPTAAVLDDDPSRDRTNTVRSCRQ